MQPQPQRPDPSCLASPANAADASEADGTEFSENTDTHTTASNAANANKGASLKKPLPHGNLTGKNGVPGKSSGRGQGCSFAKNKMFPPTKFLVHTRIVSLPMVAKTCPPS